MQKNRPFRIFVVEDDVWYSNLLSYQLSLNPEREVLMFHTAQDCLNNLHLNPAIITLDYSLPDATGAETLKNIQATNSEIGVVVISGQEDITTAVDLLKQGAFDYIVNDHNTQERLLHSVQNLRRNQLLHIELEELKEQFSQQYDFNNIVLGASEPIRQVFRLIQKAAKTNITVSLSGEAGTGKELVAKAIHFNSLRKNQPFVAINLASIPRSQMESELFGHEKGAFAGATTHRIGKFEEASKGTLHLDEITELDLNLQAKLLRVLQEKEVVRHGSKGATPTDTRIIVSTQKNLPDEVRKGNFREGLYYRLLGLPIHLPSLRQRGNDVLLLAKEFLEISCRENQLNRKTFSAEAQRKLLGHPYPGNVRELKAVVELAAVMADSDLIAAEEINFTSSQNLSQLLAEESTLKDFNLRILQHYLNLYNGNVLEVASKLDVGKSTIYRMIQNKELRV